MEQENSNLIPQYKDISEKTLTQCNIKITECYSDYKNILEPEHKKITRPICFLTACTITLIIALASYCIFAEIFNINKGYYSPDAGISVTLGLNSKPMDEQLTDQTGRYTVAGIADAVGPSIVEIISFSDITRTTVIGTGSGIIVSDTGYIVTNAHVITGGKYTGVSLDENDNSLYDAQIIGYDSKTDIAVIKITPGDTKLAVASFGNSDEVIQGEQVAAIGNPGGLTKSISVGYVSATNRIIKSGSTGYKMNCIQTDAAISPGNSGGALVNMFGQVIGITSSKYVSSSYEGIGFAISINAAKPIIEELLANGYIEGRFKIGITFNGINEAASKETGLHKGLLISSIDESCDIASSGLEKDDILFEVEGKEVTDYYSLLDALKVKDKSAGDTVKAKAVRTDKDKNEQIIDIEFKLMPDTSGDY